MFAGERCEPSSLSALARAMAGASGIRRHDAEKRGRIRLVRPRGVERLAVALEAFAVGPYQLSTAAAAHCAGLSRWQSLQALGVPSFTDRSGRGMRKL